MTTKPTDNDVLSGRGAWFNQHPGNGHFRRMLDEQKAVYIKGTKKQKMNMSNAIVESIYSMEPPGRFLKQCPDTGQWNELSRREAADRVAQAMAYAVNGKDKSKRRKERRRLSQRSLPLPRDIVVDAASSQPVDRPTNNHVEGVPRSSSVARHGLAARVSTTAGAAAAAAGTNNAESAESDDHTDLVVNELLLSDNSSNLQQQLLIQQLLQSSSSSTLPTTSSVAALNVNQNVLVQALAQALQHQQQQRQQRHQHQQQLPLQYALGHDSLGLLPTQTPLRPASLEGLNQILAQTQQQQQLQQQLLLQQQIVIQRLLNQQNALPSASLPPLPTLSVSVPCLSQGTLLPDDFIRGTASNYSTASQSQMATNNAIQNQAQPQSHPSNAHLLSMLSTLQNQPNIGLFNAPQQAQQLDDQLQRSLVRQQQQLLASSLVASNQLLLQQPPQSLPLDLLRQAWQTVRRQNENSQRSPSINAPPSANAAAPSCMQEESKDEEQSGSEEDDRA